MLLSTSPALEFRSSLSNDTSALHGRNGAIIMYVGNLGIAVPQSLKSDQNVKMIKRIVANLKYTIAVNSQFQKIIICRAWLISLKSSEHWFC